MLSWHMKHGNILRKLIDLRVYELQMRRPKKHLKHPNLVRHVVSYVTFQQSSRIQSTKIEVPRNIKKLPVHCSYLHCSSPSRWPNIRSHKFGPCDIRHLGGQRSRTLLFQYALQLSQQWLENENASKYEKTQHCFPLKSISSFPGVWVLKNGRKYNPWWLHPTKKMLLRSHLSSQFNKWKLRFEKVILEVNDW